MDQQLLQRLEGVERRLEEIYISSEKTRKYFLVTMWVTIAFLVLPAIGLFFAVPAFLNSYSSTVEQFDSLMQ